MTCTFVCWQINSDSSRTIEGLDSYLTNLRNTLSPLVIGQPGNSFQSKFLLATGTHVPGRDLDDAVGIDVEHDLDLRKPTRTGKDPLKNERPERAVVDRQIALTF